MLLDGVHDAGDDANGEFTRSPSREGQLGDRAGGSGLGARGWGFDSLLVAAQLAFTEPSREHCRPASDILDELRHRR
jgi:hypothetical protein